MPKLLCLSDLHLEFPEARRQFFVPQEAIEAADVIVLAGDIAVGTEGLTWAFETFHRYELPILYLAGNHECYGGHVSKVSIALRDVAKELGIHLLDNSSVIIGDVKFIGATLWTDFRLWGDSPAKIGEALHHAKNGIADFSVITFGSTGWMTPSDSVKLFNVSKESIENELAKPFDGKTVVVTHHLPSMKSVAERFKKDVLSAAFASNLDDLVAKADLWIHGHTHDSFDYNINDPVQAGWICDRCSEGGRMKRMSSSFHMGECGFCGRQGVAVTNSQDISLPVKKGKGRVVCNPRGYPISSKAIENPDFNPGLIVEV